jgi:hypothetical protein
MVRECASPRGKDKLWIPGPMATVSVNPECVLVFGSCDRCGSPSLDEDNMRSGHTAFGELRG